MIGVSSLTASSFSRNANGVVIDSRTNLEWQDDYSDNGNNITETTWQSAIDYCENLNLDGKSDWRLPNLNEITSLVDDSRFNPAIDSSLQNTNSNYYWSSSTNANVNGHAWLVNFHYGYHYDNSKDANNYVRCVRAGQ
jgi:rhodanese-related sulfurtransferase